jgi:hypothetical protein
MPSSSRTNVVLWLFFTGLVGLLPVLGRYVKLHMLGPSTDFQEILRTGDLFIVAAIVAGDAAGRLQKRLGEGQITNAGIRDAMHVCAGIAFLSAAAAVLMFSFAQATESAVRTHGDMSAVSLVSYFVTMASACVTVVLVEQ